MNAARRIRTSAQIAELLDRELGYVEGLMQESERDGIVEQADGGWRLTDRGYEIVRGLAEDAS
jgi:hypothetical protein